MVSRFQKNDNMKVNYKFENNTLIETTEIDLSKVNDKFMLYIEKLGEKYDFPESVESIYFTLENDIYSNGNILHEKITELINENNCKVIK